MIKMHLKGVYCIVWNLYLFKKVFEKKRMMVVLVSAVGNIGLGQERCGREDSGPRLQHVEFQVSMVFY